MGYQITKVRGSARTPSEGRNSTINYFNFFKFFSRLAWAVKISFANCESVRTQRTVHQVFIWSVIIFSVVWIGKRAKIHLLRYKFWKFVCYFCLCLFTEHFSREESQNLCKDVQKFNRSELTLNKQVIKRAQSRYFELCWASTKLPLNWRKSENNTLKGRKTPKR